MNSGYDSEVKYSNMYIYFDALKKLELNFGLFKGDFLPYQEPFYGWNDFWTGYYSTRMHMKRLIRHVFNQIQSLKSLLVFRAVQKNEGSVQFTDSLERTIDEINELIKVAEQKWSIMMHHDGITGTHTSITERSYYQLLVSTQNIIKDAFKILNNKLNKKMNVKAFESLKKLLTTLYYTYDVHHFSIVNPTAFARSEVMNFTIPIQIRDSFPLVLILHNEEGKEFKTNLHAKYSTLKVINTDTHELEEEKVVFVKIDIPAFSHIHMYMWAGSHPGVCNREGVNCVQEVKVLTEQVPRNLTNSHLRVLFDKHGSMQKFENYGANLSKDVIEQVTYYNTMGNTRSGLYLFNPRSNREIMDFNKNEIYYTHLEGLKTILQVYSLKGSTKVLRTYSIDHSGHPENQKQLYTNIEMITSDYYEMSYSLKLSKSPSSKYLAYADDSLKLVERPIFSRNVNVKATNENELTGYYTYGCVYGGMLREVSTDTHFSWANDSPLGCTFSADFQVDFWLFRNIGGNDWKGVNERFIGRAIC